MSYGAFIKNGSGSTIIDGASPVMQQQDRGTFTGATASGSMFYYELPQAQDDMITAGGLLFLKCLSGQVVGATAAGYYGRTRRLVFSNNPNGVDFIIGRKRNEFTGTTSQYGFAVYNSSGQKIFTTEVPLVFIRNVASFTAENQNIDFGDANFVSVASPSYMWRPAGPVSYYHAMGMSRSGNTVTFLPSLVVGSQRGTVGSLPDAMGIVTARG